METCAHHWLIDAVPIRGRYHAICRNCGEQKNFPRQEPRLRFTRPKNAIPPPIKTPGEGTYETWLGYSTGLSGLL
jgi:hypothetical protein